MQPANNSALSTRLANDLAEKLSISGDGVELIKTLKETAFKGNVSDANMVALLVIAKQYGLNPWTNEIYAFSGKAGGIVPIVGVDGWFRIINSHPQFDGVEFEQDDEKCTCIIYRKDRSHPTRITEYLSECYKDTAPWKSHPKRMLRHRAMIQAARIAFGFSLVDEDEKDNIKDITPSNTVVNAEIVEKKSELTEEEVQHLESLLKQSNSDMDRFFSRYAVNSINELTKANYEDAIRVAHKKLELQQAQQPADNGQEVAL